jgi:hypothetical protein
MKIGLMWQDHTIDPLPTKIARAVSYYTQKHGRRPTTCYVNPATNGLRESVDGVIVKTTRSVLPGHLWIGIEVEGER